MSDDLLDDDLTSGTNSTPGETSEDHRLRVLRDENAKRRVKNRELAALNEQLRADLDAERARAAEYQQLVESNKEALDRAQAERQAIVDQIAAANKAVIDSLPGELKSVVPTDYEPAKLRTWLDANVNILRRTVAPTDGAAGSVPDRTSDAVAVGEDEALFARAFGLDPQQLVKEMRGASKTNQ